MSSYRVDGSDGKFEQFANELSEIIGRPVDLVSVSALHGGSNQLSLLRHSRSMRREILLLEEMIDAAEQAQRLIQRTP